jgi:beta-phosphoglucomutase
MRLKGVVFDFNGTLFWDTKIHNKAWDIFLKKRGIRLSDKEKNEKIHGKNNYDILKTLFSIQLSKIEMDRFCVEKEGIYQELCLKTDILLAPGAEEFLNFLMINKIPITIATASGPENIDFYFRHLKLNRFFDPLKVVYNDGSILSKPHPQIFQKAIDVLGIMERETLVFEDSIAGIFAAENAGVGKIIIVDSNGVDYSNWNYQIIKNFFEVDRSLFFHSVQYK